MLLHPSITAVSVRHDTLADAIRKGRLSQEVGRYAAPGWVYVYKDANTPQLAYASSGNYDGADGDILYYIITTSDEDRDGDIVRPMGAHLKNYGHNPIVFFGHQEWEIPIGVCRSEDGRILVTPEENRVLAGIKFDLPDPDAAFIYEKCKRKILNATSIAFVPIEAWRRDDVMKARRHSEQEGGAGWYFNQWDMTELSIVGVPSNPGAVGLQKDLNGACRDCYDKERGHMSPKLRKAWVPYCAEAKGCWNGWCPAPEPVSKHIDLLTDDQLRKSVQMQGGDFEGMGRKQMVEYLTNLKKISKQIDSDDASEVQVHTAGEELSMKASCSCDDCSDGKACGCQKSRHPFDVRQQGEDWFVYDGGTKVSDAFDDRQEAEKYAAGLWREQQEGADRAESKAGRTSGPGFGNSEDLLSEAERLVEELRRVSPNDAVLRAVEPNLRRWQSGGGFSWVDIRGVIQRLETSLEVARMRDKAKKLKSSVEGLERKAVVSKAKPAKIRRVVGQVPTSDPSSPAYVYEFENGKYGVTRERLSIGDTPMGVQQHNSQQDAEYVGRRFKSLDAIETEGAEKTVSKGRFPVNPRRIPGTPDQKRQLLAQYNLTPIMESGGNLAGWLDPAITVEGSKEDFLRFREAVMKSARQKSSYQYGGKTIETERVSSGWHWRVEGVGESDRPLPTEDQAVEAAQEAVGRGGKSKEWAAIRDKDGWWAVDFDEENRRTISREGPYDTEAEAEAEVTRRGRRASLEKPMKAQSDVPCPRCKGEGVITVSGQEQQCPRCNGAGVMFAASKQADIEPPVVPGRDQNPEEKMSTDAQPGDQYRMTPKGRGYKMELIRDGQTIRTEVESDKQNAFSRARMWREAGAREVKSAKALEQSDGRIGGYTVPPGGVQSDKDQEPLDDPEAPGWTACGTCHGDGNCGTCGGTGEFGGTDCEECGGGGECSACVGQGHTEKSLRRKAPLNYKFGQKVDTTAGPGTVVGGAQGYGLLLVRLDSSGQTIKVKIEDDGTLTEEKSVQRKRKQLDEPTGPTAPQVLAALYSHAKAEAAYLDQLDDQYKDTLADYRRQQVEERMDMLKYQFSRAAGPDDDLEKMCKDFEDEHDKGMESTGPDSTVEPGEAGLVEQGQIPEEKADGYFKPGDKVRVMQGPAADLVGIVVRMTAGQQVLIRDQNGDEEVFSPRELQHSKSNKRRTMKQNQVPAEGAYVENDKDAASELDSGAAPFNKAAPDWEEEKVTDPANAAKFRVGDKVEVTGSAPEQGAEGTVANIDSFGTIKIVNVTRNGQPYSRSTIYADGRDLTKKMLKRKAAPGTDEWAEEEAAEPEHKGLTQFDEEVQELSNLVGVDSAKIYRAVDSVLAGRPRNQLSESQLLDALRQASQKEGWPIKRDVQGTEEKQPGGGICMCGAELAEDGSCPSCGPAAEEKAKVSCPECSGSGNDPSQKDGKCKYCYGSGKVQEDDGFQKADEQMLEEEKLGPLAAATIGADVGAMSADKDSDPATEEILERYQTPKGWRTRKHRVSKGLLKFLKYRVAADRRKYLVRAKQKGETPDGSGMSDDEVKRLTTKLARAIDDLKSLALSKHMPRELKVGLKGVADQIWHVGKALTDKGKEQRNGGSGSELIDAGKEQRNGGKGSELKDKGEQQGKTPTKSVSSVSPEVVQKLLETEAKLSRFGLLNGV